MLYCEDTFYGTRPICKHPAKFMVIAPMAPRVVCGVHVRKYMKRAVARLPAEMASQWDNHQLPDINRSIGELKIWGADISVTSDDQSVTISIQLKV